jgi:hypothetical protein
MLACLKEVPMRVLVRSIIAAAAILAAEPARAQTYYPNYPVCMKVYSGGPGGGGGEYIDCGYTSLAQCAATASGRAAYCVVNPFWAYGNQEPPGRIYHQRHRAY